MPSDTTIQHCCAILGVARRVTRKELKRAFRRKVRACHPDMHPDRPEAQDELKQVIRAYHLLDEILERHQNERLEEAFQVSGGAHLQQSAEPAATLVEVSPFAAPSATGALAGLAGGLAYAALTGGLKALSDVPAPQWSLLAFVLTAGLLAGALASALMGVRSARALLGCVVSGMVFGAAASTAYNSLLSTLTLDPARAWSLVAFSSGGGLLGGGLGLVQTHVNGGRPPQSQTADVTTGFVLGTGLGATALVLLVCLGLLAVWCLGSAFFGI